MMKQAYDLYLFSCNNINSSILNNFIQLLSQERQKKAIKYRHEIDTTRTVCGEMLLRYGLSKRSGSALPETPLQFTYNSYGKPILPDYPDIFFNISHSGDWVACAVSDSEIGIDIEQISLGMDLDIANHYFHEKEIQLINSVTVPESYHYFFQFWTAKESYLKCIGKGLGEPLNNFYVSEKTIILENKITPYHINFYKTSVNYVLSVCCTSSFIAPASPSYVSIEDILQNFS
ncbi:4'-phosphopantetheinyl transferase superfamily protein [Clostridium boliviensis]|uniref:4'-phosphopantetheinyl transferase superfamily protein n=1 Tax=Clostridium boliviensis TaxID=318465 RepID=A0ABU4GS45_9CLOT|nr:4'-phosphopantetheinyl transferase superfamily protein [Clostridium boliviensis]MDW2800463.1 4'-phosphopantetheinyl transferase superfamily protein [Clostridium boliviensis]